MPNWTTPNNPAGSFVSEYWNSPAGRQQLGLSPLQTEQAQAPSSAQAAPQAATAPSMTPPPSGGMSSYGASPQMSNAPIASAAPATLGLQQAAPASTQESSPASANASAMANFPDMMEKPGQFVPGIPGQMRQGLGQRTYPQLSMALAGLGRAY